MPRKKFFNKSFPSGNKQKKSAAIAKPNLVSPTESKDDQQHASQQQQHQHQQPQQSPAKSLHSTISRSPTIPAPKTGILRYHLNDDNDNGKQKKNIRTSSSSSIPKNIPKILLLIERGDWISVEERARQYPHECSAWVSLVKKILGSGCSSTCSRSVCSSVDGEGRMVLGTAPSGSSLASLETSTSSTTAMACNRTSQCKALHHACKKLRSVHGQIQRLIQQHRSSEGEGIDSGTLNSGYDKIAPSDISFDEVWRDESDKDESYTDPWIEACKAILALIKAHPKAAGERESRHGCLPLHLAAFAMQRTKTSGLDKPYLASMLPSTSGVGSEEARERSYDKCDVSSPPPSPSHPVQHLSSPSTHSNSNSSVMGRFSFMDSCSSGSSCCFTAMLERDADEYETKSPFRKSPLSKQPQPHAEHMKFLQKILAPAVISRDSSDEAKLISTGRILSTERPPAISTRVASTASSLSSASTTFNHNNLTAISLPYQPRSVTPTEQFTSSTQHFNSQNPSTPSTKHSSNHCPPFNLRRYLSNAPTRDHYSLLVIKALLSAYPPSPRVDSEGGRLPLHMALEGHATLPVLQALVDAYPPAARRRTGDGFLPLHLAAERGVGDTGVAGFLLAAYPDGGIARNRFDRTPLEEALLAAGENGRSFQTDFIRTVVGWGGERGVGGYVFLPEEGIEIVVNESSAGNEHSKLVTPTLQTVTNLIQSHSWEELIFMVETHPDIANQKIYTTTRSGIPAQTTLLYLVSEQNPTYDVIDVIVSTYSDAVLHRNHPGGKTSLHAACTWGASEEVVGYLLAAAGMSSGRGGGARQKDMLGNLPLHAACYAGAKNEVISSLLCTLPKAVEARNIGGFLPGDLVRRLWKGERGRVVREMIEKTKMELEEEKERTESDDSERDQGEDRKVEKRMNRFQHEVTKSRTPDEKRTKEKSHLSRILKQERAQKLNEKKDGLLWI